jgi:hypothetical protein
LTQFVCSGVYHIQPKVNHCKQQCTILDTGLEQSCLYLDEPEWPAEQRGEFYGFISGTTNLTCEANAEPPAEFTWLDKSNNEIMSGQVYNQDHKSTLSVRLGSLY